jgi:hypothetical protein
VSIVIQSLLDDLPLPDDDLRAMVDLIDKDKGDQRGAISFEVARFTVKGSKPRSTFNVLSKATALLLLHPDTICLFIGLSHALRVCQRLPRDLRR